MAQRFQISRAAKRGGFKRGGFPIWTCPFFCPFCPFWDFPDFSGIFPICSGMVRGFSRFVLFLFLGLLIAPTRNSPERVRDTIWTFPEKSGKHPGLETPRFSLSQKSHDFNAMTLRLRSFTLPQKGEAKGGIIDLLMGLFRGAVFRHGGGALEQPIKEPTETPTSTLALMGRFPSLMGRFPTLMGRFTDFVPRGRSTS